MKRFELGMWLFIGAFTLGLALMFLVVSGLSMGLLYVYGRGNPVWFDELTLVTSFVLVLSMFASLWLMYGGDDGGHA